MCQLCPSGYYCVPVNQSMSPYAGYKICPRGYYCPNGTGLTWHKCPPGTYSNTTGLQSADECLDCPPGKYCDGSNSTTFTGSCDAGYFCTSGVDSAQPTTHNNLTSCNSIDKHLGKIEHLSKFRSSNAFY